MDYNSFEYSIKKIYQILNMLGREMKDIAKDPSWDSKHENYISWKKYTKGDKCYMRYFRSKIIKLEGIAKTLNHEWTREKKDWMQEMNRASAKCGTTSSSQVCGYLEFHRAEIEVEKKYLKL